MTGTENLTRFLDTDPLDIGCDATFAELDVYVERTLSAGDAERRHPRIAAHLLRCPPCHEDYEGLLAAARG